MHVPGKMMYVHSCEGLRGLVGTSRGLLCVPKVERNSYHQKEGLFLTKGYTSEG